MTYHEGSKINRKLVGVSAPDRHMANKLQIFTSIPYIHSKKYSQVGFCTGVLSTGAICLLWVSNKCCPTGTGTLQFQCSSSCIYVKRVKYG